MASRGFFSFCLSASIFVVLFSMGSAQSSCMIVKDVDYYLSLSVDDFYNAVSNGNRIGTCYNAINTGRSACYHYANCQYPSKSSPHGCPLDDNGRGTGCVRAPDFPKGVRTCYYRWGYSFLTPAEINSFCTDSGKANVVAQLKWALRKGYCNIPCCVRPEPCKFGTPGCKCICRTGTNALEGGLAGSGGGGSVPVSGGSGGSGGTGGMIGA